VPLDRDTGRAVDPPQEAVGARHPHLADVGHHPVEILQVGPEPIDHLNGSIDGDGLPDIDAAAPSQANRTARLHVADGARENARAGEAREDARPRRASP